MQVDRRARRRVLRGSENSEARELATSELGGGSGKARLVQSVVSAQGGGERETEKKRGSRLGLGEPAQPQPGQRSQSSAVAEDRSTD